MAPGDTSHLFLPRNMEHQMMASSAEITIKQTAINFNPNETLHHLIIKHKK